MTKSDGRIAIITAHCEQCSWHYKDINWDEWNSHNCDKHKAENAIRDHIQATSHHIRQRVIYEYIYSPSKSDRVKLLKDQIKDHEKQVRMHKRQIKHINYEIEEME